MRWPFRRQPKGRHALGAAVTAIPSAPVRVLAPLPSDPAVGADAAVTSTPSESLLVPELGPALPDPILLDVGPTLLVPGPPVPVPPSPVVAPRAAEVVPPAAAPVPLLPVQPVDLEPALLDLLVSFETPGPSAPAPPSVEGRRVEAVASECVADEGAPAVQEVSVTGPRVELGFADGTTRTLDPASSAAQQLSDLVAELTGKDAATRPSAS